MLVDNFTIIRTNPKDWKLSFSQKYLDDIPFADLEEETKYRDFLVEQCKEQKRNTNILSLY